MPITSKATLPHRALEFYQGRSTILWTHPIAHRATGWLNENFHREFREVLLHACGCYGVSCPGYVLMPDHWHLVWVGLNSESDQQQATAFLRRNLSPALGSAQLQDHAHDRILHQNECLPAAFQSACSYVFNNARRSNLCADWREWPFLGAIIMGYPGLDPRNENFWAEFWKIHHRMVDRSSEPCTPAQGYISATAHSPTVARSGRGATAATLTP